MAVFRLIFIGFRVASRAFATLLFLFGGLAVLLVIFPFSSYSSKQWWIAQWSRRMLQVFGLQLQVHGAMGRSDKALVVANHSSWIDILVINSLRPAAFIAKAEIARWPLVGMLVARSGTLFIERGKRQAVHAVLQSAIERIKQPGYVAVFPEGTTNDGTELLAFHGNLIEAAIRANAPVQPLAISYENSAKALSPAVIYVGEMTFVRSIIRVLSDTDIHVHLRCLPEVPTQGQSRHELALQLQGMIGAALGLSSRHS